MRLYRVLLQLYPASFREDYEDELCDAFEQGRADHPGLLARLGFYAAAATDVGWNALAAHADLLARDTRDAWRVWSRRPYFAAGCLLTLAIGIGANGAVFGILRSVLLQPLPYHDPGRLVMLWRADIHPPSGVWGRWASLSATNQQRGILTPEMVMGWRAQSTDVLGDVAALETWQSNYEGVVDLVEPDRAERLRGALVTPNFFDLMGVHAWQGRLFSGRDAGDPSTQSLVVISYGLWQRAFGGDPSIIGRPVTLIAGKPRERGPKPFIVAGVLPPAFRFTYPQETEIWTMLTWPAVAGYYHGALAFQLVARLRPGISVAQARQRFSAIRSGLERTNPDPNREIARVEPIADWVVGSARPPLMLLAGVAALLLLITCATVANALLVRAADRRRELALRASLGASAARLRRQLVTEGVLIAVVGALAGTCLAAGLSPIVRSLVPSSMPRADEIRFSTWVLGFGAAAAGACAILAGLFPAWSAMRFNLSATLKGASAGGSGDRATARWRGFLVGSQAAIATSLLAGAVLLMASLWRLGHVPLGFDGERVLTVEISTMDFRYFGGDLLLRFQSALIARVRAMPGVMEAGLTSAVPFRGVDLTVMLGRPDEKTGHPDEKTGHPANARFVDPAFFSVMRIGLVRGRFLSDQDTPTSEKTVVISEALAHDVFGAGDPIGQQLLLDPPTRVVGIVRDVRYVELDRDPRPAIYLPISQNKISSICIVARTSRPATELAPGIRAVVRELDPTIAVMNLTTVDQIVSDSMAGRRFYTTATVAFALIALVLTVVGLAVIVARSVLERRRELAIRGALGATAGSLVRLVARRGLAPVVAGTVAGLAATLIVSTKLADFLFQVSPREPAVYGGVALLIVSVAVVAAVVPARRAARTAPALVLQSE